MGVMGYYYMKRGDIERARPYHKILKSLAPDQPQTQRLDRLMRDDFSPKAAGGMDGTSIGLENRRKSMPVRTIAQQPQIVDKLLLRL